MHRIVSVLLLVVLPSLAFAPGCRGTDTTCEAGDALCNPLIAALSYDFRSVAIVPNDFDGDGISDFAAGAAQNPGLPGYAEINFGGTTFFQNPTARGTRITGTDTAQGGFAVAAGLGDINADGIEDFGVGEIGSGGTGGKAYIFLGRSSWPSALTSADADFTIAAEGVTAADIFGVGMHRLGDLNGDGIDDFAVGATGLLNSAGANRLYVFYGSRSPSAFVAASASIKITGGDATGRAVACLDWNGDGQRDLVVSAYRATGASSQSGLVYVFYGGTNLYGGGSFTASEADLTLSGATSDLLGETLVDIGDVNLDGYNDLFIGARSGVAATDDGRAYIVYTGPGTGGFAANTTIDSLSNVVTFSNTSDFSVGQQDYFGQSGALVPDLNSDGYPDLLISASKSDSGLAAERALFFSLTPSLSGTVTTGQAFATITSSDKFGWLVATPGDLNRDGTVDIAISHFRHTSVQARGIVRFFDGANLAGVQSLVDTDNAAAISGAANDEFYGVSMVRGYSAFANYLQSPYVSNLQLSR